MSSGLGLIMKINGIKIDDTFAEAFPMQATRILITAQDRHWAAIAAEAMTGFATSSLVCGCEAGIERELSPDETPDARPGFAILLFAMNSEKLTKQLQSRVSQCVLMTATSACFAGIHNNQPVPLGSLLRYFGDGWQVSKVINGKRYWRVPVMEGEFVCEETTGLVSAIGGSNFFILATTPSSALAAAEIAIEAMRHLPNVIMPFPGGIVRAGFKFSSRYKNLMFSTNHLFCPTLKGQVNSALDRETDAVLEIVINGLSEIDIQQAMRVGIQSVCALGRESGVTRISAGNYGGEMGSFHFHLQEILA
jgi:formylmethanofuran--tetrahydromethanopterin N-formyltransferase